MKKLWNYVTLLFIVALLISISTVWFKKITSNVQISAQSISDFSYSFIGIGIQYDVALGIYKSKEYAVEEQTSAAEYALYYLTAVKQHTSNILETAVLFFNGDRILTSFQVVLRFMNIPTREPLELFYRELIQYMIQQYGASDNANFGYYKERTDFHIIISQPPPLAGKIIIEIRNPGLFKNKK